ncbi:MAG: hypothetical protein KF819_03530 [Labilithrix sp.]|nr:hypothetical protein [Labilithrix sp.]
MLNDRIAQTLDALNQVRLSVHAVGTPSPISGFGIGFPGFGLSHTAPVAGVGQVPFGQVPFGQVSPWFGGNTVFPQQVSQTFPTNAFDRFGWNGLSHTTPESIYGVANIANNGFGVGNNAQFGVDPYFQQRMFQTFPFWGVTPYL